MGRLQSSFWVTKAKLMYVNERTEGRANLQAGVGGHWFMSSKATEYRREAEECERAARLISLQPHKDQLRRLAQEWRRLAEECERRVGSDKQS